MRTLRGIICAYAVSAIMLLVAGLVDHAQAQALPSLTGQVLGPDGVPLEGVVVSANNPQSTITISVVSGADGRYIFPAGKLRPGNYNLSIRAAGFELDGDGAARIAGQQAAAANLKLKSARDLAAQLTNAEWIESFPGTQAQKSGLLNCIGCHTLERVARSTYTAEQFFPVLDRMYHYAQVTQPIKPQVKIGVPENLPPPDAIRRLASYLSTLNLSATPEWKYPLKTFPRVSGRSTRVVITEYGLPRPTVMPHDVIQDEKGQIWYSNFGEMNLGTLDPKTGKVTEYPVPLVKEAHPVGMLDLEADKQGDLWLGVMHQGAIAKFDRKTKKIKLWSLPKEGDDDSAQISMITTRADIDGKIWTCNVGHNDVYRLDVKTGQWEHFEPYKGLPAEWPQAKRRSAIYGLASDSRNNLFFTDFIGRWIGRVDAKTGETKFYETPTDNSRPRRGAMDDQDRYWFAEYGGNRVAMLDTKSEGPIKEWEMPTPWTAPYDVIWDKNGELWTGGMTTDRIVRLDPKTSQITEYPLPNATNLRRVFVDNSTTPVTFWVGNNLGAAVVKIEPLD